MAPAPLGTPGSSPASLDARSGSLGTAPGAPTPSPLDVARSGSAQGRPDPSARGPGTAVDRAEASSGPDIGWALACAGLLLAAAILGLTGDGRDASKRTRARLARNGSRLAFALRPLFGRR